MKRLVVLLLVGVFLVTAIGLVVAADKSKVYYVWTTASATR